jgi:hypothetical protein
MLDAEGYRFIGVSCGALRITAKRSQERHLVQSQDCRIGESHSACTRHGAFDGDSRLLRIAKEQEYRSDICECHDLVVDAELAIRGDCVLVGSAES